jgi:hypothetical protein
MACEHAVYQVLVRHRPVLIGQPAPAKIKERLRGREHWKYTFKAGIAWKRMRVKICNIAPPTIGLVC